MSTQRKYERLSSLANSYGSGEVPAAVHAAGRERLIGALAKRRAPSRARTVGFATAFAAAAAIAIAVGFAALRAPLGWHVDGAAEVAGDYVRTDSADAVDVPPERRAHRWICDRLRGVDGGGHLARSVTVCERREPLVLALRAHGWAPSSM
jgi:hypothetical protein